LSWSPPEVHSDTPRPKSVFPTLSLKHRDGQRTKPSSLEKSGPQKKLYDTFSSKKALKGQRLCQTFPRRSDRQAQGYRTLIQKWDPFEFSPPSYLLRYDPLVGTARRQEARAIPSRVTVIIKAALCGEIESSSRFTALDNNDPTPAASRYTVPLWKRSGGVISHAQSDLHFQELV